MRSFEGFASVDFMNMQKGGEEMNKMIYGLLAMLMVSGILFQIAIKLISISSPNQLKTEVLQDVLPFFSVLSLLVR